MTIATILNQRSRAVVTVGPEESVQAVVALLAEHRIGAVPVVEDGGVVGIFSERDAVACLARDGAGCLGWPVERVMTRPVITVPDDVPLVAALSLMTQRRVRHLPVVAGGRLIGFVSIGDLVKARIDRIESEAAAMRDYIAS